MARRPHQTDRATKAPPSFERARDLMQWIESRSANDTRFDEDGLVLDAYGRFLLVSPKVATLLGGAPTTLAGRRLLHRIHRDSRALLSALFVEARTRGSSEALRVRLSPRTTGVISHAVFTVRDVSRIDARVLIFGSLVLCRVA